VVLNRYAPEERAGYFWLESRREGVPPFAAGFGSGPLSDDAYQDVAKPLLAGRVYRSRASERVGAYAEANRIIESGSDLIVPIFVGGACRGCLGFNTSSDARDWTDAEVAVLETAASAVAAAIARHDVEQERRHQTTQQANDARQLNRLLEGVVRASRALMDTDDFQTGLEHWLEFIARGVDADAALLGELRSHEANVATTNARWGWQSISPPVPTVPATSDFVAWAARLEQGESIWAHIDELEDPASVQFWRDTHCETNLLMPVVAQGATIGWVGFDWSKRCEWRPAYATILRTAADGLAAAIGRHRALQATLAEREYRVALERARADEAAAYAEKKDRSLHLLSAVAASAEDLLRAGDPMECMERVLERIGTITRAQRACLGMVDWTSEAGDEVWLSVVAEWTSAENVRQMGGPMHRFSISRGEQAWRTLTEPVAADQRMLDRAPIAPARRCRPTSTSLRARCATSRSR
jgi:GAF domain-containing protein